MRLSSFLIVSIGIVLMMILPSGVIAQTSGNAGRVWEAAIEAKGGRAALYRIHSIFMDSTSQSRTISGRPYQHKETAIMVLPFKGWSYTDDRPEVFGETVSMVNYENMTGYFGGKGNDIFAAPLSADERELKNYQNPTIFLSLIHISEPTRPY